MKRSLSLGMPDFIEPLQLTIIAILCIIFFLGHTLGILLTIYLLLTPFYALVILYLFWTYIFDTKTPHAEGRRFECFRKLKSWKFVRDFFPIQLVRTAKLNPKRNYVFGYHPHGIMCFGAWLNFSTEATGFGELFPGITPYLMTLKIMFKFPFFRDFVMAGGVCDVSKESLNHCLQAGPGNAAVIVVGGAAESLEARPGSHKLTLKNRKGFVKIALQNGASLVPVYSFGENDLFNQANNPEGSWLRRFQAKFQSMASFAPPLFYGRGFFEGSFGFLPRRVPIYTVVGSPIIVKKAVQNPTQQQINSLHKKYVQGLIKLFNKHKHRYGVSKDTKLVIQ